MQTIRYLPLPGRQETTARIRSFLTVVFRQRRIIVFSFLSILMGTMLAALLAPKQYRAEVKILVRRERQDPPVSADPNSARWVTAGLTEQEINSEVDLLQSNDLLQKVVVSTGLAESQGNWFSSLLSRFVTRNPSDPAAREEEIARQVDRKSVV